MGDGWIHGWAVRALIMVNFLYCAVVVFAKHFNHVFSRLLVGPPGLTDNVLFVFLGLYVTTS